MNSEPSTVYIVDDNEAFRRTVVALLESVGLTVRAYPDAQSFLRDYSAAPPECLLLDVRLPGMSGLELQQHMKTRGIEIPIIFITGYSDITVAIEAMKQGAHDFMSKPFNPHLLIEAVHSALEADRVMTRHSEQKTENLERLERLTPREKEVLDLVVQGLPSKRIASELGVSKKTIDLHRSHIMHKTCADSLAELVRITLLSGRELAVAS